MPACGLVASYRATELPSGPDRTPYLMNAILTKSITMRGFIQDEFIKAHYKDFQRDASAWIASGELRYREHIIEGLENAPDAFVGLLSGKNFGKLLIRVGATQTTSETNDPLS